MPMPKKSLLDFQWRFFKGDFHRPTDGLHWAKGGAFEYGPLSPSYDDSRWRVVNVPHDFVVEGDFTRDLPAGVGNPASSGTKQDTHMMHGYLQGGVGWYRKTFFVPAEDDGRMLALEFDGVFRNSTVWLNKHYVGTQASGYMGFRYDVSALLNYGGFNTVVVRADATEYEGWFYEGGGIYRHVWLINQDPLHLVRNGIFVTSEVDLNSSKPSAKITVRTEIANTRSFPSPVQLRTTILDPAGRKVAEMTNAVALDSNESREIIQAIDLSSVELWSVDQPRLYSAVSQVMTGDEVTDEETTSFGIRKIHFDADQGFFLNDQPVKLKGVCCHQDHAGVGSALPDRLQSFRIERLKEMGCNAYRTAHHPPTPELLEACDRLGMLVMDETRLMGTAPDLMAQLRDLVRRDRNHPSVILWSIGNEEVYLQGTAAGARIAKAMMREVRRWDTTRLITLAMNGSWGEGASPVIDVLGCNYINNGDVDAIHAKFPRQPIVFSESASALGTRGIYAADKQRGYVSAYDTNAAVWGATHEANWKHCSARPFISGTFVWTGFDYRGEPTPYYNWPCISSHFGIIDTCGFPKDPYYYYQSCWSNQDVLHLFPHWNWKGREGQEIEVWAFSNFEEVELSLNGKSVGRQAIPKEGHLVWKVPYAPGILTAVGYRDGREIKRVQVETTGPAAGIRLVPDRIKIHANGEDLSVVRVELVDAAQRLIPNANPLIRFEVDGPGTILGVGNGDPSCHESDKGTVRSAFNGLCQVLVQSSKTAGTLRLRAVADGLLPGVSEITAETGDLRLSVPETSTISDIAFEHSAVVLGKQEILAVAYPSSPLAFTPIPMDSPDDFCTVRKCFEKDPDGFLYVRMIFKAGCAGSGSLLFGPDGPLKVWVNGVFMACDLTALPPAKAEANKINVPWNAGANEVMFALSGNQGNTWGLYARVCFV